MIKRTVLIDKIGASSFVGRIPNHWVLRVQWRKGYEDRLSAKEQRPGLTLSEISHLDSLPQ